MKRILFSLFPSFFTINIEEKHEHVCKHTTVNLKDLKANIHDLKVVEVEPEAKHYAAGLGINEERNEYLSKKIQYALLESKTSVEALERMNEHVKHANELAFCAVGIYKATMELRGGSGPFGGIIGAIMAGMPPPPDSPKD